ncbi:MAG: cobalamin B12-binding protein [uncultured bacterium]|nr:MAG: cobalamin B12-binding protein [uncultured bacterium]
MHTYMNSKNKLVVFIYPGHENLAIEYLSSYLKKEGFQTQLILDPIIFNEPGFLNISLLNNFFDIKTKIINQAIKNSPLLIALSVVSDNFMWAISISSEIKKKSNIPIVIGGVHPTAQIEECLQTNLFDFVCFGEGEISLVELCNQIYNESYNFNIPNIAFKKNNSIHKGIIRPLINLDDLPIMPDKDLYYKPYPLFNDGYIISTSRGCPYRCSYCNNSMYWELYKNTGRYYRKRKVNHVIEELKLAKSKYNPSHIFFLDESFNADTDWLKEFLNVYKEIIQIPFYCFLLSDLSTRDSIRLLAESGCYKIQFGFQTADENLRRNILNRYSSNESVKNLIKWCKEFNIFTAADTIMKIPGENETIMYNTAEFYTKHTPDSIETFWMRYYPGTKISSLINPYLINSSRLINQNKGITIESDTATYLEKKVSTFLNWIPFLPSKLAYWIVSKKYINFFPRFPSIFLIIFKRILKNTKYDLNVTRTYKRYLFFIRKHFTFNIT